GLFIEEGFMNVTVHDIAKQVGIARTTFYEYYTDKAQILVDVVDRAITTFKISPPEGDTMLEKLTNLAEEMLHKIDANREIYTLIFREAPILAENVAEKLMAWRYDNASVTRAVMAEADKDNNLYESITIDEAVFIFTALLGQRAGDILIADEAIDTKAEAERMVRMVWRCISQ
ncbi:MAG TPA: TetR/AcrR family transcriptional regulator, partial [Anaerolineales bacterium]|nr:TetR/AcrR family transcriptional regulator [Anaerolineales bacterium]